MSAPAIPLTPRDLTSGTDVRWCPGCGDYSILAQLKKTLAGLGIPRERLAFVSGVGCSGRLPYYLHAYGFQAVHGRAPAVATGLKLVRPELSVWVITGDGDGLSIGGNHLMHALRRNVDLKVLLFNNETMGLTRGQFSPTTRPGTRTRSSPFGSLETPLRPVALALAAEATFVARTLDVDPVHLDETLRRAAAHKGSAFVEIYQNCHVFNDGVFAYATDRVLKPDHALYLTHGRPLLFGPDQTRGLRLRGLDLEAVELGPHVALDELLIHDEQAAEPTLAFLLGRLSYPDFPECFGVFRCVERPTFGDLLGQQTAEAARLHPDAGLQALLAGDETWEIP
jgi:2-oxoglutarate/2-oxoacid ferredoxin oxidoreductase subunit beta